MHVICIGSASRDILFPTAEGKISETPDDILSQRKICFELGAKYNIEKRYEALGGCAANVAVGLSRLGAEVSCYAALGSDSSSEIIIDALDKEKVDTKLIEKDKDLASDLSAIVVDQKSGERTIFTNREVGNKLEIKPEKLEGFEWIFIGDVGDGWEDSLEKIILAGKDKGINLAFNPREKAIHENVAKVTEAINHSKIVFVNKDEAIEIVMGFKNESKEKLNDEIFLIKSILGLGAEIAVLTDGKRGAWAGDKNGIFFTEAENQKPIETTGAGDAFTSAFLAAHIKGKELSEALKWGSANAGQTVGSYGAIQGLLREEEIEKSASQIKIEKVS